MRVFEAVVKFFLSTTSNRKKHYPHKKSNFLPLGLTKLNAQNNIFIRIPPIMRDL